MLTLADSEAVLGPESLAMPPVTPPVTQPQAAQAGVSLGSWGVVSLQRLVVRGHFCA